MELGKLSTEIEIKSRVSSNTDAIDNDEAHKCNYPVYAAAWTYQK